MKLKLMQKLQLISRMWLFRKKDNLELKKNQRLNLKKKPSLSIDKEEFQIMKQHEAMMEEDLSDLVDLKDHEALVLEPLEVAPRVDHLKKSSERELLK